MNRLINDALVMFGNKPLSTGSDFLDFIIITFLMATILLILIPFGLIIDVIRFLKWIGGRL